MNVVWRDRMALLSFVGAVAVVAAVASFATIPAAAIYKMLDGPAWAPPAWLYAPVWTVLYGLMAVAGWLVWREGVRPTERDLALFGAQLALNGMWSPLFFGLQWRGWALVCIVALDVAVGATLWFFWNRRRLAAALMAPYFAWLLFATALNFAYWRLNL